MTNAQLQQTLEAERKLGASFENYAGQWVAIRDHEVVESADTLNGLLSRVDPEQVEAIQHVNAKRLRFNFF